MEEWQVVELTGTIIDHIADMVVVLDQRGTIRYANARSEEILGVLRTDWIGRPVFELVHPDDMALAMELLVSTQAAGSGVKEPVPFRVRKGDGSWATVEVITSNIELVDGELALALSGREITRRRPSIEIINEASERLARMFADAAIGMTQTGLDGRLLRVNRSFADLLDVEPSELIGRTDAEFTHPDDRAGDEWLTSRLRNGDLPTYRSSKRYVAADGRIVYVEVTASLVRDRHGVPLYCATQVVDVTALEEARAELVHQSTHDPLTGLANRALLRTMLDQALARAARRNESIAVLFLDLDGFKLVNDAHGHATGDALLVQVAERLLRTVRGGDVVSRFGGDEFVVMCEHAEEDAIDDIARRIIETLAEPFQLGAVTATIGVSVGLAIEDASTSSVEDLLSYADAALYGAKGHGRGRVHRHMASS